MSQTRPWNLFILTCVALPFLTSLSLFSSDKRMSQASSIDISSQGFGIMGDSNSDEYQADDHRGGEYASTTMGWVEQLVKNRGLNFGPWGTWGEPRRTGYEYNWARSGATAESMISSGQHTGLARQVAEGKVSYVFLWIGTNDFHALRGSYKEIYDGSLSDEQVRKKESSIVANITLAVDTVLAAGPVNMVIVDIRDIGWVPQAQELYPDAAGRQRVSKVIQSINQQLGAMAAQRHINIVAADDFTRSLLERSDQSGYLHMGNTQINLLGSGNEPQNLRLRDSSGHPGTVASGLIANVLFITPFNSQYDTNIASLTDEEILENAGINSSTSTITTSTPNTTTAISEPITMEKQDNRMINSPIVTAVGSVAVFLLGVGFLHLRRHRHGR